MEISAEVISIGDELTSGVRLDTNTQWISQRLGEIGIHVAFHSTVGDHLKDNVEVFRVASQRADLVISTGGLGPTADDLTRHAISQMAGDDLILLEPVLNHIKTMYSRRGREMPPNNEIQAWFPMGSKVIPNPEGTAPGIDFSSTHSSDKRYRILALPGVPVEMKQMWDKTVEPELKTLTENDSVIHHHTIHCFGSGESHIETLLPGLIQRGRDPSVGITASAATISLRVSTRGDSINHCNLKMESTLATIRNCLGDYVFGENGTQLENVVTELLRQSNRTIAIMDHGLGGAVARAIKNVDIDDSVLVHAEHTPSSELKFPMNAKSVIGTYQASFGLVVSPIDREEDKVVSGDSKYTVAIASSEDETEKEFRFSGHSGWREARAVKEVLNYMRLHLLKTVKLD